MPFNQGTITGNKARCKSPANLCRTISFGGHCNMGIWGYLQLDEMPEAPTESGAYDICAQDD